MTMPRGASLTVLLVPPGTVSERSLGCPQFGQFPGSLFPHEASGLDANAASRKNPAVPRAMMPRVKPIFLRRSGVRKIRTTALNKVRPAFL